MKTIIHYLPRKAAKINEITDMILNSMDESEETTAPEEDITGMIHALDLLKSVLENLQIE